MSRVVLHSSRWICYLSDHLKRSLDVSAVFRASDAHVASKPCNGTRHFRRVQTRIGLKLHCRISKMRATMHLAPSRAWPMARRGTATYGAGQRCVAASQHGSGFNPTDSVTAWPRTARLTDGARGQGVVGARAHGCGNTSLSAVSSFLLKQKIHTRGVAQ
jgi:hypothetical protein